MAASVVVYDGMLGVSHDFSSLPPDASVKDLREAIAQDSSIAAKLLVILFNGQPPAPDVRLTDLLATRPDCKLFFYDRTRISPNDARPPQWPDDGQDLQPVPTVSPHLRRNPE